MIYSICLVLGLSIIFNSSNVITGIPLNLPERNAYGEVHLIATLTNQETGDVTYMEEYLSTKNLNERGKIEVTRNNLDSFTIFYNENDDFRLVMTDTDCTIFKYNNKEWSQMLPNVHNELENIIIMFGPTIYYRIQSMLIESSSGSSSLVWEAGDKVIVRGIQMDTKHTVIEKTLNVTVYHQGLYVYDEPYRVDFAGFLPETMSTASQLLTIDFYLVEILEDLSYQVAPTPGIGCSEYLEVNKAFPEDNSIGITGTFHFSAIEITSSGDQISLEVYVDSPAKIVRYIVDYSGTLLETVYDYNLGISYTFVEPSCVISPMVETDVGVLNGGFDVQTLLWQTGTFQYLGKYFYEQRSGIICDVWEAIEYDTDYEGTKYAKTVTTYYFTEKTEISGYIPYNSNQIPVSMTKKFYNLDSKKNYRLDEVLRRDVYDFVNTIPEVEYQTTFQISDCDNKEKDKLWLTFVIKPVDSQRTYEAIQTAEQNLILLREGIRDNIVKSITISPLRIADMDFDFSNDTIYARIMFLEKPDLTDGLVKQVKKIDSKSIQPYQERFESLFDCAFTVARYTRARSFAWCKDSNNQQSCAPVINVSSIVTSSDSNSIQCEIYNHPVGDLKDLVYEFDLSSLHESLLNRPKNDLFMVGPSDNERKQFKFTVTDILYSDVSEDVKESKLIFSQLLPLYKLKSDNPLVYSPDQLITTLGDCYHICESSEAIDCTSFSYCINPKDQTKVSCLLTSQVFLVDDLEKSRESVEADDNCNLYSKNHILDYVRIKGRQIISTGVKELVLSPEICAAKCAASAECKSFDYCDKSVCALSDTIYLDRLSEAAPNCDSYLLKRTENFKVTGTELVDDIMFSEEGINLDQCASLCFDYSSGNDGCTSFNYCPKGRAESTCQLSQSKIKSKSSQTTSSIQSKGYCFNYELIEDMTEAMSNNRKIETQIVTSAGGGLLAIVMFSCLAVGLIYGFIGEYIYLKVNNQLRSSGSPSSLPTRFTWSRQVDDAS